MWRPGGPLGHVPTRQPGLQVSFHIHRRSLSVTASRPVVSDPQHSRAPTPLTHVRCQRSPNQNTPLISHPYANALARSLVSFCCMAESRRRRGLHEVLRKCYLAVAGPPHPFLLAPLNLRAFLLHPLTCRFGRSQRQERNPGRCPCALNFQTFLARRSCTSDSDGAKTPWGLNDVRPCTVLSRASRIDQQQVNAHTRTALGVPVPPANGPRLWPINDRVEAISFFAHDRYRRA